MRQAFDIYSKSESHSTRLFRATYRSLPAIVRSGIVEYPSSPTTAGLQTFALARVPGVKRTGNILRKATCEEHTDHPPSCVDAENKQRLIFQEAFGALL
jgi:hypothetical protein